MATASTGLSSPGVGSGLDVNSIVSQLVAIERRPISALQVKAQRLQTEISGVGQMQSFASELRDAASALAEPKAYEGFRATSSDSSVISAAIADGAKPAPSTYAITTVSLAAAQAVVTAQGQFASSAATVGEGTLTITRGRWAEGLGGFTGMAASPAVPIQIAATDTLAQVRDKINAAGAGVSAAIITDSTGARLSLRSTETGADNGFRVTVADTDGNHADTAGLSRLAFDPPGGTSGTTRTMAGSDAVATVNGIEVRSPSNTFDGTIEGLSFTVQKAPAEAISVSVSANTDSVRALVARFVAAYNALAKFLSAQTRYDAETKQAGLFQGDSGVVGVFNQMRGIAGTSSLASPSLRNLSSLGIEMQRDGTLQINSSRLESALENLPELASALSREVAGQPMLTGSMVRFKGWADALLGDSGSLPGKSKSLKAQLTDNQRQQERYENRVAQVEKRLRAQYTALDTTMSKANALSDYVSQQIDNFRSVNKS